MITVALSTLIERVIIARRYLLSAIILDIKVDNCIQ